MPTSAHFLPHFWHRSGTNVAISWRKKMSSKVLPKNRVMCLKNLGGVWGGSLPTLEVKKTCGKILALGAVKTIIWTVGYITLRAAKRAKNFGTAQASNKYTRAGVPLKVKKKISRHKTKTLSALQKYLEVLDEDLEAAISTLNF